MHVTTMKTSTKRRMTYATIGVCYALTGVEYGVIFPTLWSYLHVKLGAPSYMLGIVISAFNFSALFASPVVGRWADRTPNVQLILLTTNIWKIAGNFLYFWGGSSWMLAAGRLVSGIGAGSTSAITADITRSTSEKERTPILAVVIACRQIGLMLGPSMNLILRQFRATLGPFELNECTAPGFFLAILWFLMEFVFLALYYNLSVLCMEERLERRLLRYTQNSICVEVNADRDEANECHKPGDEAVFTSTGHFSSPLTSLHPTYVGMGIAQLFHISPVQQCPSANPSIADDSDGGERRRTTSSSSAWSSNIQIVVDDPFQSTFVDDHFGDNEAPSRRKQGDSGIDLLIESAERLISSTSEAQGSSVSSQEASDHADDKIEGTECFTTKETCIPVNIAQNSSSQYRRVELSGHESTYDDYTFEAEVETVTWEDLSKEFLRDEVIVLLAMSVIVMMCQTSLEAVVTPLCQELFGFGDAENSYLYLGAGVEMIAVFLLVRVASRSFSDRSLLVFGLGLMLLALIITVIYVPTVKPVGPGFTRELAYFIILVFLDLIAIPILFVCSTSLLSKVTSRHFHALGQGLRASMVSLGCILGPLWGTSLLEHRYILFAVLLSLFAFLTVLFGLSFKRLKPSLSPDTVLPSQPTSFRSEEVISDRRPLLPGPQSEVAN